jgi:hypothetical protein
MSLFTTDRERRLWFWTLAAIVAIYSTLGPAETLYALLREHNLLRVTIALVTLLVVFALAVQWVKSRPDLAEIVVALGVAVAYLMVWWRVDSWEERTHLIEGACLPSSYIKRLTSACATAAGSWCRPFSL